MSLPRRCINYFHVGFLGRHMGRMVCEKLAMGRGSQSMGLIFFPFLSSPGHQIFRAWERDIAFSRLQ